MSSLPQNVLIFSPSEYVLSIKIENNPKMK